MNPKFYLDYENLKFYKELILTEIKFTKKKMNLERMIILWCVSLTEFFPRTVIYLNGDRYEFQYIKYKKKKLSIEKN